MHFESWAPREWLTWVGGPTLPMRESYSGGQPELFFAFFVFSIIGEVAAGDSK